MCSKKQVLYCFLSGKKIYLQPVPNKKDLWTNHRLAYTDFSSLVKLFNYLGSQSHICMMTLGFNHPVYCCLPMQNTFVHEQAELGYITKCLFGFTRHFWVFFHFQAHRTEQDSQDTCWNVQPHASTEAHVSTFCLDRHLNRCLCTTSNCTKPKWYLF